MIPFCSVLYFVHFYFDFYFWGRDLCFLFLSCLIANILRVLFMPTTTYLAVVCLWFLLIIFIFKGPFGLSFISVHPYLILIFWAGSVLFCFCCDTLIVAGPVFMTYFLACLLVLV